MFQVSQTYWEANGVYAGASEGSGAGYTFRAPPWYTGLMFKILLFNKFNVPVLNTGHIKYQVQTACLR